MNQPQDFLRLLFLIFCILFSHKVHSQVGINTSSPSPAAVLDVNSSNDGINFGGFMPPKVSLSQRNNIPVSPNDDGLMVYLTDGNNRCVQIYNAIESVWGNVYCMPVNNPPVASNVQIAGLYQENQTLTASFDYTDAESDAPGAHVYTWLRANDSGGSGQIILQTGTSNTFLLTASQVSFFIAVEVTPVATTGTSPGSPVTSAFGGPVIDAAVTASDLFISEYVEGSSNNKAIEVANFTGATINLSNYRIRGYQNGSTVVGYTYTFPSVNLANGEVYVITHGLANPALASYSDAIYNWQFNGNDVVELVNTALLRIDIIGIIGSSANFAIDTTLRKKPATGPNTTYDANDYDFFPVDTFTGLGSHTF